MIQGLRTIPGIVSVELANPVASAFLANLRSRRQIVPMRPIGKPAPPNRLWPIANRRGGFMAVKIMPASASAESRASQ